jgi:hypothetical protein
MRIRATWGAAVGIGIAVLMISLDQLRPHSAPVESFINRTIFMLCPPFMLGFTEYVNSTTSLYLIAVAGNALLYGAVFAVIALVVTPFQKYTG